MQPLKCYKKLITVFFALFVSISASANIITESLVGEVFQGSFSGEIGAGTFSYDNALVTGVDEETLNSDEFSIEFTIFGQSYTNISDVDFPDFPLLDFIDGTPVSLVFAVSGGIVEPSMKGFEMFDLFPVAGGGFQTEIIVEPVPLPVSAWLFSSGLLSLIGLNRKKNVTSC